MVRLALFMNANTKNPEIEHCHIQNMVWYTGLPCTIYRSEKTSEKWSRVKIHLSKYAITK